MGANDESTNPDLFIIITGISVLNGPKETASFGTSIHQSVVVCPLPTHSPQVDLPQLLHHSLYLFAQAIKRIVANICANMRIV